MQPPLTRVLHPGDRGDDVLRVQRRLSELHWEVALTGDFNDDLALIVEAFQHETGCPITGLVDAWTWRRLWSN